MAFSGGLQLTDLDDFLGPSQDCVVATSRESRGKETHDRGFIATVGEDAFLGADDVDSMGAAALALDFDDDGQGALDMAISLDSFAASGNIHSMAISNGDLAAAAQTTSRAPPSNKASISLADCLACSGCVTTAESVLVNAHSVDRMFRVLGLSGEESSDDDDGTPRLDAAGPAKVVLVSVSPQSCASLAVALGYPGDDSDVSDSEDDDHDEPDDILEDVAVLLKNLGVHRVFNTNEARMIALIEQKREFMERWEDMEGASSPGCTAPMLASSCPGFVCYAEKTTPEVLPYISRVRSPQQITGAIIKREMASAAGVVPSAVFHVTVMPCYDKKLEATRSDFLLEDGSSSEVDLVLTTSEFYEFLQRSSTLESLKGSARRAGIGQGTAINSLFAHIDSELSGDISGAGVPVYPADTDSPVFGGSGGYVEYLFRQLSRELFEMEPGEVPLSFEQTRNKDFHEVTLFDSHGTPLLRFATAYGFRNIRNVVDAIKGSRNTYHYIEIMACPSGCLNGGGQIKPDPLAGFRDTPLSPAGAKRPRNAKQVLAASQRVYNTQFAPLYPETSPFLQTVYRHWETVYGDAFRLVFRTDYRALQATTNANPLLTKW